MKKNLVIAGVILVAIVLTVCSGFAISVAHMISKQATDRDMFTDRPQSAPPRDLSDEELLFAYELADAYMESFVERLQREGTEEAAVLIKKTSDRNVRDMVRDGMAEILAEMPSGVIVGLQKDDEALLSEQEQLWLTEFESKVSMLSFEVAVFVAK
jgi:hypothetical protein